MSIFTKVQNYIAESIAEMRKVAWPKKEQTINYTILVIVLSVGVALSFGILDYIFSLGLEKLIK